jgi:pseudaminic acid synthase
MNFKINNHLIGSGQPAYIIAEMSANHNQSFDQAVKIIEAAKEAGADAIKLQTYTPDTLTIDCDNEYFRIKGTLWEGKTLYELYKEAYTPWEWQPKLQKIAQKLNIDFFSTPFDNTAIEFLEKMNIPAYKVASFENVDMLLLRRIAQTGKPVIMSTGMATLEEINEAVNAVHEAGCSQLALLKCTSAYPAPPEEMNLRTISNLIETFTIPVGLSDHSLELAIPVAAVALGASIIEKHFTLSRNESGPDSSFSLEPREFKNMVDAVRTTEKSLGSIRYNAGKHEESSRIFRRSIFVVGDVKADEQFTPENLRVIRPSDGLPPKYYDVILGKTASRDIKRGSPMSWELMQ